MKLGKQKKMALETFLYTLPALLLVALVIYIPFVLSGFYSFTKWNGIAKEPELIGFGNFVKLFSGDKDFVQSLLFTGKYTLFFMIIANVLALALAVILTKKIKTANLLRGFFFIPYIMSMTIVGFIWKFIFSQGFAKLYEMSQLEVLNLSWLGNPDLAFYSIVFVGVWQSVVDGANGVQKFFRVILPLLAPSITTCIFMSLTNSLKVFDIILALTKGGPGASTYSVTLNIYREAFQNNNYGYGAAKSLVFFLIILVLTQLVLRGFKSREVEL